MWYLQASESHLMSIRKCADGIHTDETTVLEAAALANQWPLVQALIQAGSDYDRRFQGRSQ